MNYIANNPDNRQHSPSGEDEKKKSDLIPCLKQEQVGMLLSISFLGLPQ